MRLFKLISQWLHRNQNVPKRYPRENIAIEALIRATQEAKQKPTAQTVLDGIAQFIANNEPEMSAELDQSIWDMGHEPSELVDRIRAKVKQII